MLTDGYVTGIASGRETYADNITGDKEMNAVANRGRILLKAREIINGERQDQYGNPEDCFKLIGELWSVYLTHKQRQAGALLGFIGKKDVAMMMVLFKLAREMNGPGKEDNLIDAAGYLGIAADIAMGGCRGQVSA